MRLKTNESRLQQFGREFLQIRHGVAIQVTFASAIFFQRRVCDWTVFYCGFRFDRVLNNTLKYMRKFSSSMWTKSRIEEFNMHVKRRRVAVEFSEHFANVNSPVFVYVDLLEILRTSNE